MLDPDEDPAKVAMMAERIRKLLTQSPLDIVRATQGRRTALATTYEVIINGKMFECLGSHGGIDTFLAEENRNNIRYRATPSDDPDAWFGMDLETVEASEEVDLDAAVKEERLRWEW